MAAIDGKVDRQTTVPFHLKLFYREGAFPAFTDFVPTAPPPHLTLSTWPTCTLSELTAHLISTLSNETEATSILPSPVAGTRLSYRLIFPSPSSNSAANSSLPGRYTSKDLGSVVVGEEETSSGGGDGDVALKDVRFVIGDFVAVAILPPLGDGSVAPPLAGSTPSGPGAGGSFGPRAGGRDFEGGPRGGRENGHGSGFGGSGFRGRDRDLNRNWERGGGSGRGRGREGFGGGFGSGRGDGGGFGFGRGSVPMGEWRRGEQVPSGPAERGGFGDRGRGGFGEREFGDSGGGGGGFRGRDRPRERDRW